MNSGLIHFAAGAAPSRLGPEEHRYTTAMPHTRALTDGAVRFCIEDKESNARRYEVPDFAGDGTRPCLVLYSDCGSDNVASMSFALGSLRLRCVVSWDCWHSWHNAWINALKQAGQWGRVQEMLHVLSLHHGPWNSEAFWRTVQETVSGLTPEDLQKSEVWLALGELIAQANGISADRFEDPSVQQKLLAHLPAADVFRRRGDRTAMRSWFRLLQRLDEFLPDFHLELLV